MPDQMYAIYHLPPHTLANTKAEVRSYGTVVTGDDPDGPPFDSVNFGKKAVDHQPGPDEEWDHITKDVVLRPIPPPTLDELRLVDLEAADDAAEVAIDALIDSDETTWNIAEVAAAAKGILRRQRIDKLKKKTGKP